MGHAAPRPSLFAPLSETQAIAADYASYGLSVRGHPMSALRRSDVGKSLPRNTTGSIKRLPSGRHAWVSGLVIARQKPYTAKGTVFATLEDEEGFLDLILHEEIFERYHDVFVGNAFLMVAGKTQADRKSVSLLVRKVEALPVGEMRLSSHDFH
jgi:error-prone DNA polymerase